MDGHDDTARHPSGERPWSAYDMADHYDRSVDWAWSQLARWRAARVIQVCGTDAITRANLYPAEQIRAAFQAEHPDQHPEG